MISSPPMKERKDKHFIKKPSYPGGRDALRQFIKDNLVYPPKALESRVQGTVSCKYTIDHKGKVTDVQVISGLGYGCDEEAERLVRLLKFVVPKNARKVRVTFHKDIHIHFRLPKTPQRPNVTVSYSYTQSKEETSKTATSQSGSYNYTISIGKKDPE